MRFSLTLTLSSLMIWFFGQMALAYLPTALSVALRPLFLFQQVQYALVFLLRPAPFCMLFAGLGSIINFAISLLLLSDSGSVLSFIFPSTSNSLADMAGTAFPLLLFHQATMGPRTLISPGERRG